MEAELLAAILSQLQDFGAVLIVGVGIIAGLIIGRHVSFWGGY